MTSTTASNLALMAGFLSLMIGASCVLFSGVMYYKYWDASLHVSTTQPFVYFSGLSLLYDGVSTVREAWGLQDKLMEYAWCTDYTGNYNLHPQTRAPACSCINDVYVKYMDVVMADRVNDSVMLLGNETEVVNASRQLQALHAYFQQPWEPNAIAGNLAVTVSNASVAGVSPVWYKQQTVLCLKYRSVWREHGYFFRLHPLAMFFYTSFALFIFGISYFLRVQVPSVNSTTMKVLILILTLWGVSFIFFMNPLCNWIYSFALMCIWGNFMFSIDDEYCSIVETSTTAPELKKDMFIPPHPLKVGIWYYMLIFFPMLVVYLGLSNLMRDIGGLFGLYVVGYLLAACMQRYFWTKSYLCTNMRIETMIHGYEKEVYVLTAESSTPFRWLLELVLLGTSVVLSLVLVLTLFMGWYSQGFYCGNWVGLVAFAACLVFFGLEFFAHNSELLAFTTIDFTQSMLCLISSVLVLFGAYIDAALV